jgi:hypothetical protein
MTHFQDHCEPRVPKELAFSLLCVWNVAHKGRKKRNLHDDHDDQPRISLDVADRPFPPSKAQQSIDRDPRVGPKILSEQQQKSPHHGKKNSSLIITTTVKLASE